MGRRNHDPGTGLQVGNPEGHEWCGHGDAGGAPHEVHAKSLRREHRGRQAGELLRGNAFLAHVNTGKGEGDLGGDEGHLDGGTRNVR